VFANFVHSCWCFLTVLWRHIYIYIYIYMKHLRTSNMMFYKYYVDSKDWCWTHHLQRKPYAWKYHIYSNIWKLQTNAFFRSTVYAKRIYYQRWHSVNPPTLTQLSAFSQTIVWNTKWMHIDIWLHACTYSHSHYNENKNNVT
jgi:hypothetical protein